MSNLKDLIKTKKIIIGITIFAIIVLGVIIFSVLDSLKSFSAEVKRGNYSEAIRLYNEKIKYDTEKLNTEKVEIKQLIDETIEDFNSGKIGYEQAKDILETVLEIKLYTTDVNKKLEELDAINNSKIAFIKAKEYLISNDYYNAIVSFNDVVENDTNYTESQNQMNSILKQYKQQIFDEIEKETDSDKAIKTLEKLSTIAKNDTEVQAKIEIYKQKQMENLINQQEVSVISAKPYKHYYSSTTDGVTAVVKNNTNKVIKDYVVGILAYDSNGYPLQIEYKDTLQLGEGTSANVQPNATYGEDKYFYVSYEEEKISTVLACVKNVTYYDGTTWENPYYEYWLEEYKDKPYSK